MSAWANQWEIRTTTLGTRITGTDIPHSTRFTLLEISCYEFIVRPISDIITSPHNFLISQAPGGDHQQWIATIVTQCHNMGEFIGVCQSFISKNDAIMRTNLCSAEFEMFWTLWTCGNHSESFVTWRHCAWQMICDVKLSGKPTCVAALQNLKNTCYVHYAPLLITHVSNKGLSADSLPSNPCSLLSFWRQFDFQSWSDQNRKIWPVVIFREAAWPCAIDFMNFIGSFVATKIRFYDL